MTPVTAKLILASKSSIRVELMRSAGLVFDAVPAGVDERALEDAWEQSQLGPADVAVVLAEAKALAVSHARPDALVVGADQTLDLDGERFTKALDGDEARQKLERLRGRTHHLHSGYAIARGDEIVARGLSSVALTMRDFDDAFLERYLKQAGESVLQSVGCYQFENLGMTLFDRVEGDYFSILGLPMLPLLRDLRLAGLEGL